VEQEEGRDVGKERKGSVVLPDDVWMEDLRCCGIIRHHHVCILQFPGVRDSTGRLGNIPRHNNNNNSNHRHRHHIHGNKTHKERDGKYVCLQHGASDRGREREEAETNQAKAINSKNNTQNKSNAQNFAHRDGFAFVAQGESTHLRHILERFHCNGIFRLNAHRDNITGSTKPVEMRAPPTHSHTYHTDTCTYITRRGEEKQRF
jgi:hypothetical protein